MSLWFFLYQRSHSQLCFNASAHTTYVLSTSGVLGTRNGASRILNLGWFFPEAFIACLLDAIILISTDSMRRIQMNQAHLWLSVSRILSMSTWVTIQDLKNVNIEKVPESIQRACLCLGLCLSPSCLLKPSALKLKTLNQCGWLSLWLMDGLIDADGISAHLWGQEASRHMNAGIRSRGTGISTVWG